MGNRYVYKKRRYICAKGMVEIEEHAPVYEDEELEKEATCRQIIGSVLLTVFRNKWNTNIDANIIKLGIIAKNGLKIINPQK